MRSGPRAARRREFGRGLVLAPLPEQRKTEVVVGVGVAGRQLHGLSKLGDRLVQPPLPVIGGSQAVPRISAESGPILQRLEVLADRLMAVADIAQRPAEVEMGRL